MTLRKRMLTMIACVGMVLGPAPSFAAGDDDTKPGAGAMAADAMVGRPLGFVMTVLGTTAFVVSLPFSALGGNIDDAANQLVVKPAKATFVRCLGCTNTTR